METVHGACQEVHGRRRVQRPIKTRMEGNLDQAAKLTSLVGEALERIRIDTTPEMREQLASHLMLVQQWNAQYNLTAIRDVGDMILRHVCDSATALGHLTSGSVLDAGSGAGFPGLVLAILAPRESFCLVEANGKKARFLEYTVRHLGLIERVRVVRIRLEDWHPAGAGYDNVVVRALAPLNRVLSLVDHLVARQGQLIVFKGQQTRIIRELEKVDQERWDITVANQSVPGLDAERNLCLITRSGVMA